jgi:hypothetical protein
MRRTCRVLRQSRSGVIDFDNVPSYRHGRCRGVRGCRVAGWCTTWSTAGCGDSGSSTTTGTRKEKTPDLLCLKTRFGPSHCTARRAVRRQIATRRWSDRGQAGVLRQSTPDPFDCLELPHPPGVALDRGPRQVSPRRSVREPLHEPHEYPDIERSILGPIFPLT